MQTLTLKAEHLYLDTWLYCHLAFYMFAESRGQSHIIVHGIGYTLRYAVADIETAIRENKTIHNVAYERIG